MPNFRKFALELEPRGDKRLKWTFFSRMLLLLLSLSISLSLLHFSSLSISLILSLSIDIVLFLSFAQFMAIICRMKRNDTLEKMFALLVFFLRAPSSIPLILFRICIYIYFNFLCFIPIFFSIPLSLSLFIPYNSSARSSVPINLSLSLSSQPSFISYKIFFITCIL